MSTQKVNFPIAKREKVKSFLKNNQNQILTSLALIFVGLSCFALGRLTVQNELQATFIPAREEGNSKANQTVSANEISDIYFIGSKSGSKYHWPWCSFAQKIKEENRVIFKSEQEAKNSGYSRCSNFLSQAPMGYEE